MKKILLLLLISFLVVSCGQKKDDIAQWEGINTSSGESASSDDLWKTDEVAAPLDFPESEWSRESPYNLPE